MPEPKREEADRYLDARKHYTSLLSAAELSEQSAVREAINQCFFWCLALNSGALTALIGLAGSRLSNEKAIQAVLTGWIFCFALGAIFALFGRLSDWYFHYTVIRSMPTPGQALSYIIHGGDDHAIRAGSSGRESTTILACKVEFARWATIVFFFLSLISFLAGATGTGFSIRAAAAN